MRVVHLSTTDTRGGASRGSYWLHHALRDKGIDSIMLVGRKYSDDPTVVQLGGASAPLSERIRGALDGLPLRLYNKTKDSFWTLGWMPRNFRRPLERIEPDLVHLHWTGGGFMPVSSLGEIPYPVVWTLRDMWAFTGGCHYTAGCARFESGCGLCPQLRSNRENDLSRILWRRKFSVWRNDLPLHLVTISKWLAGCAADSPLFDGVPVDVIPNGLDSKRFHPISRDAARAAWDLDPDKRYILFGALGALKDERKGFRELTAALRILASSGWPHPTELIVFGDTEAHLAPPLDIETRFIGHIDDDDRLAQLYAAADVMVVPSLQEAFGKTLIEAMACGTPVVAFNHGGPADIVIHKETGYLAEAFDPESLAEGIAWCLQDEARASQLGRDARTRVERSYDMDVVADCYRRLYARVLGRSGCLPLGPAEESAGARAGCAN